MTNRSGWEKANHTIFYKIDNLNIGKKPINLSLTLLIRIKESDFQIRLEIIKIHIEEFNREGQLKISFHDFKSNGG